MQDLCGISAGHHSPVRWCLLGGGGTIRAAGYDTITPVVVTNKKKFASVTPDAEGEVAPGGALLTVVPKEAAQPTA